MASQPDSPTTTTSHNTEQYIDRYDIVATQGAYLGSPVRSLVFHNDDAYNADFAQTLEMKLRGASLVKKIRTDMYHGAADEYLPGFTPFELRVKRYAEMKALAEWECLSTEDSDLDPDERAKIRAEKLKDGKHPLPDWLPSPPTRSKNPRRRRFIYSDGSEGDKEKERPTKGCAGSTESIPTAENAVPNTSRQKGRKRQWPSDADDEEADDEEENDKERPKKARMTGNVKREWTLESVDEDEDDKEQLNKEKERPTKRRAGSIESVPAAENAVPNTSRQKGRKRQRPSEADDEEDYDKEQLKKARMTSNVKREWTLEADDEEESDKQRPRMARMTGNAKQHQSVEAEDEKENNKRPKKAQMTGNVKQQRRNLEGEDEKENDKKRQKKARMTGNADPKAGWLQRLRPKQLALA